MNPATAAVISTATPAPGSAKAGTGLARVPQQRPAPPMNQVTDQTLAFYLGTHEVGWLTNPLIRQSGARLFISYQRLRRRRHPPRSLQRVGYAVDSGGFTEITRKGGWTISPREYVDYLVELEQCHGQTLDWAAAQDWMCEPEALAATGRTVLEHQHLTVQNFCELWQLWPHEDLSFPIMPTLQGRTIQEYVFCRDLYARYGVPLHRFPVVAVGSLCRRQNTTQATQIVRELATGGLRLHAFGFKTAGLLAAGPWLTSADSLAWSDAARRAARQGRTTPGCSHRTCSSCPRAALAWLDRLRARLHTDPDGTQNAATLTGRFTGDLTAEFTGDFTGPLGGSLAAPRLGPVPESWISDVDDIAA